MGVIASKLSRLILTSHSKLRIGPPVVPKGYFPVSVGTGEDSKRFIVHVASLRDSNFLEFLSKSEEAFGFCNGGVLQIPCDIKSFEERMFRRRQRVSRVRSLA
ncbi:hypothetical protein QJS04_geneDACA004852 [Acorus gramineus]|uniref:Uncharacterized protein n=1 Tax=Acorus gramineus TaxID=55184 RepID=A0AAV9BR52_ACOGR|nr:hypothetical protein QJS04_geneDACA004853 [Acorus gramineus]KAK1279328.1 hypothetical protein QJS04_geneDACA004852 [Acorus gramineus]